MAGKATFAAITDVRRPPSRQPAWSHIGDDVLQWWLDGGGGAAPDDDLCDLELVVPMRRSTKAALDAGAPAAAAGAAAAKAAASAPETVRFFVHRLVAAARWPLFLAQRTAGAGGKVRRQDSAGAAELLRDWAVTPRPKGGETWTYRGTEPAVNSETLRVVLGAAYRGHFVAPEDRGFRRELSVLLAALGTSLEECTSRAKRLLRLWRSHCLPCCRAWSRGRLVAVEGRAPLGQRLGPFLREGWLANVRVTAMAPPPPPRPAPPPSATSAFEADDDDGGDGGATNGAAAGAEAELSLPAHALVLAARSPYFAAMLGSQSRWLESAQLRTADVTVRLTHYPAPVVRAVLRFLYIDDTDLFAELGALHDARSPSGGALVTDAAPPWRLSRWIATERDADLRTRQQFAVTVLCAAHELMLPSLQAVTEGVLTDLGPRISKACVAARERHADTSD